MTKGERLQIESDVRAALREAKQTVAVLKAAIEVHVQNLHEAEHYLAHFISDPLDHPHDKISHAASLIVTEEIQKQAEQLVLAAQKVRAIQARIDALQ